MTLVGRLLVWWRARRRVRRLARITGGVLVALGVTALVLRLAPHPTLADRVPLSTAVIASDGTVLRLTLAADGQYRLWTPLPRIAPALARATLLYEDRHFYRHFGVNPLSLARAAFATYLGGGRRIGGSTITMQLARRLWSLSSRTVAGKAIQILRALELEARYSKQEILEAYLNVAPYGGNIEGVGAASQLYFHKPAEKLTLAEALTLAVVPQSPGRRASLASDPGGAASANLDRARTGLLALWTERNPDQDTSGTAVDGLEAPDAERPSGATPAASEPPVRAWPTLGGARRASTSLLSSSSTLSLSTLSSSSSFSASLPFRAPHFVEEVLAEDAATRGGSSPDDDASPGRDRDRLGVLATTLDSQLQRLVERHLQAYVARERRRGLHNAAALLVDARAVAVRALVGSAGFFDETIAGQVNGTLARRSPGSTLKPFAYGLGLDQGVIHPATMLRDVPTAFAAYSPENFDGRFVGPLSAKDALVRSRNVPALAVAGRLGRPKLYDFLKTAGVDLPLPEAHYGLGLVLGTGEVTMHDLVRLYAALANGGVMLPLAWRTTDEGKQRRTVVATHGPPSTTVPAGAGVRLLSAESAYLVLDMLAENPRPASGRAAALESRPLVVSWKTGTSWGFRDAWAVGVFGPYVLAVWVGDFSGAGNPAFVGAQAAGPLFFEIVDSIASRQPEIAQVVRPVPPGLRHVEVCALSGGLPTPACPHRRSSWFIPGRSPIDRCAIHRTLPLDAQGRRTCATGPAAVRGDTFEVWPSDLAKLFTAAGLPRRPLPPPAPGCGDVEAPHGEPPRITSPLAGVTYTVRAAGAPSPRPEGGDMVALQAVTDGDAANVYWFADQIFLGKAARGTTFLWRPPGTGHYTVRAVDDLGRADARPVAVEVMR